VFEDVRTGETDYGERSGPGHASCKAHCPEGMQPPEPDDETPPLPGLVFPTFRLAAAAARRFKNGGAA
jgi:hypothetical protein